MTNVQHEQANWLSKIQQEREEFKRDIEIQRKEIQNSINQRAAEIETSLRNKEEEFEQKKAKELQYITSQKDMIKMQLEHIASQLEMLASERKQIALDREQRERELSEIKSSIELLNIQREKLQEQRNAELEPSRKLQKIVRQKRRTDEYTSSASLLRPASGGTAAHAGARDGCGRGEEYGAHLRWRLEAAAAAEERTKPAQDPARVSRAVAATVASGALRDDGGRSPEAAGVPRVRPRAAATKEGLLARLGPSLPREPARRLQRGGGARDGSGRQRPTTQGRRGCHGVAQGGGDAGKGRRAASARARSGRQQAVGAAAVALRATRAAAVDYPSRGGASGLARGDGNASGSRTQASARARLGWPQAAEPAAAA
uniref:Uncharacterized protein n=1 Tax=Ananas comosus var. bracteatus TaxID=296719 RepID=A0A6V7Q5E0_ANACO|nr:unnamed protein product [Ananas comosus var. bracteatus]